MMEMWRRSVLAAQLKLVVTLIACIQLGCINGATDPNDAAALRVMYGSLNSPGQLTQWSSNGDDPCGQGWKGVTCSKSRVTELKLNNLGLSGSIGYQFSSLTALTNLDLSYNSLAGSIPYNLPPSLRQLNLASNQFTGDIPWYFSQMTSLTYLNLAHNQLQNQLNDIFGQLSSLSTLDLSFNSITGDLPESFSNLSSMKSMYLQNNQFTGPIDVLANLPLETLNIGNNHFSGWIPSQLNNINLQKEGNNFNSGPAPPPPPGTPAAHKNPGHKSGGNNSPSDGGSGGGSKKSGIGGGGIAGIIISLLVVGAIVAFFLVKRRSRKSSSDIEKLDNQPFAPHSSSNEVQEMKPVQASAPVSTVTFDTPAAVTLKPPPIDRNKSFDDDDFSNKPVVVKKPVVAPTNVTLYSVADLQIATGSFSIDNLLGEGSFGSVYRAQFDDGKVLAVKKIDSSALPGEASDDFTEIVSKISLLHHPNVTELVGYCSEHGQHLLVYEFHKNGSLHDLLHLGDDYGKPLIWNTRVKIALGTARALEYLHESCSPSVVHKNIKSANILLDMELNPHLSDSGLASNLPNADQVNFEPHYILMIVYRCYFYLLSRPRAEQSLVRWATPQLHDIDALSKMVDPALKGLYPVKSLSRFADVIALCVQPEPEFRPPMSEVVQALVRLVQRANMSKRTVGSDQGVSPRANASDGNDYM
ncbi:Protein STRUBBELIG-REPTOR FAMILY 6 [Turnera subulata]|uniref:Protein STRUBBELIG-REPTOR FAMILY 6 n=1 Tax=Turnera subulata TaxID=218843 RepID=A0A9Q0G8A8_9ROSI|nr:Protein STRUBBELIG-REPTOR FAMILY 6 [Turnera subulata]